MEGQLFRDYKRGYDIGRMLSKETKGVPPLKSKESDVIYGEEVENLQVVARKELADSRV